MLPDLDKGDAVILAACLRDTVALSTLPALWSGAEPVRIAESLAAALCTTLGSKFVYVAVITTKVRSQPSRLPKRIAMKPRHLWRKQLGQAFSNGHGPMIRMNC